ncbi:hypothetical protein ENUP19_0180G0026 [Entamoeba nuttalli]|uniref:TLDc domain-containing protein n=2 Tax=Entamoeba nuttalli TaxID=412467 RepID=K2HU09_ENTNP|nr:hypothetical protein ENU1_121050 [Entamoeba nuttalli P19]EKE39620.1 hypothetical protein ENU1_121050 [Entamoeba nuttalli P19]|eukprot:XP_008858049.1 hypothetical protein ENU1_121050 [Entamoeba nuttalli P19]
MGNEQAKRKAMKKGSLGDLSLKENKLPTRLSFDSQQSDKTTPTSPRSLRLSETRDSPIKRQKTPLIISRNYSKQPNLMKSPKTQPLQNEKKPSHMFLSTKSKSSLNLNLVSLNQDPNDPSKRKAATPRAESSPRLGSQKEFKKDFNEVKSLRRKSMQVLPSLFQPHRNTKKKEIQNGTNLMGQNPKELSLLSEYISEQIQLVTEMIKTQYHVNTYQVIYDSTYDELSSRFFNSKVCCHKNMFIIVTTKEGYVLGFFQEDFVPLSPKFQCSKIRSNNFKVFGFGDQFIDTLQKTNPKDDVGMILYPNRETSFIFTCHGAFWVLSDGKVYIHQGINNFYNVDPSCKNPLIHYKMQKFLILDTLIVFEWK